MPGARLRLSPDEEDGRRQQQAAGLDHPRDARRCRRRSRPRLQMSMAAEVAELKELVLRVLAEQQALVDRIQSALDESSRGRGEKCLEEG